MMKIHTNVFVGAALVAAVLTSSAAAGVITHSLAVPPGPDPVASGPGLGLVSVPIVITQTPNNDNQTGGELLTDNNIDVNIKRFDFNDFIDIEFSVRPSGILGGFTDVTEYRVVESVDNATGLPWVGYRMQLGFGTGANFTPAGGAFGLDFDTPDKDAPPSSTAMTVVSHTNDEIVFSGFHGAGMQLYSFRIDVPDLFNTDDPLLGAFTLRQIPVPIPEPSAVVLAGLAMIGLAWQRRRG